MGIHGLFAQLGPPDRVSLAKLAADHYKTHSRPFRLAIDISIWLFQIQAGRGGQSPELRTFYYRLLRLLALNIHPVFVFDGPNKPLWKRNKKVGGPGIRVASVPEFFAKDLLDYIGFPWHVAPGEAEAECAHLQCEGLVDAVLSEDVDTLMFGCGMTIRNSTQSGTTKSPTHVDVYRAKETLERSGGIDHKGMVLVALMSGGDYVPEGIPGIGPKVACDAARAGFGAELCRLGRNDKQGLVEWKERLQHEIRTNENKFFSRRLRSFNMPHDFPNLEALGYYTHPCVSSAEKIRELRQGLRWDQRIDHAKLRAFTANAFDWRCLGGAKKFIKNLAPALLMRQLRTRGEKGESVDVDEQERRESELVHAIHGKRNHQSVDGELEYRISFTPAKLVPIDLSIEEDDDQFVPAGGAADDGDTGSAFVDPQDDDVPPTAEPPSPTKTRTLRPYFPDQPERLWVLHTFLQLGCPLSVEDYEGSLVVPRGNRKTKLKARAIKTSKKHQARKDVAAQTNTLMQYVKVSKSLEKRPEKSVEDAPMPLHAGSCPSLASGTSQPSHSIATPIFRLLEVELGRITPIAEKVAKQSAWTLPVDDTSTSNRSQSVSDFAGPSKNRLEDLLISPKRATKHPPIDGPSPTPTQSLITAYCSGSRRRTASISEIETIDLISPPSISRSNCTQLRGPLTPTTRSNIERQSLGDDIVSHKRLPDTVTRRRRRGPLKRAKTAPTSGDDYTDVPDSLYTGSFAPLPTFSLHRGNDDSIETENAGNEVQFKTIVDITSSSPIRGNVPSSSVSNAGTCVTLSQHASTNDSTSQHEVSGLRGDHGSNKPGSQAANIHAPEREIVSDAMLPPTLFSSLRTTDRVGSLPPEGTSAALPKVVSTIRRSPHLSKSTETHGNLQIGVQKKRVMLRESLEGAWKEIDATALDLVDMTGDGSGWKRSKGKAKLMAQGKSTWRKSEVDILDLTGA